MKLLSISRGPACATFVAALAAAVCIAARANAPPKKSAKPAAKNAVNNTSRKIASKADAHAVARGSAIFERATCAGCHPAGGNSLHPSHPLKGKAFRTRYRDEAAIERVIRKGVPNTGMPGFGKDQINDKDMRDLLAYLKSLTP